MGEKNRSWSFVLNFVSFVQAKEIKKDIKFEANLVIFTVTPHWCDYKNGKIKKTTKTLFVRRSTNVFKT